MKGDNQVMDFKKLLADKGLTEEQINDIVKALEEQGYIPKHRFDEVNEAKKSLEEQIAERDKQLAELKKAVGDNEVLKQQIEKLQSENKTKDVEYQAKLKDMAVTTAIKLAVAADAHDPDLITTLLDKSKVELDDKGNIKAGLDEQLKALRESKAFLFKQKEAEVKQPSFKGIAPADGKDSVPLGETEQVAKTIRENLGF
jgi:seryl-tRNA synthetase